MVHSAVAPFTGAWIEIFCALSRPAVALLSLPSRERGLKYNNLKNYNQRRNVAPFTGAWIEIACVCALFCGLVVAPFTGAWIEIMCSPPMNTAYHVAPFTGAWIEIAVGAVIEKEATWSLPSRERGLKS